MVNALDKQTIQKKRFNLKAYLSFCNISWCIDRDMNGVCQSTCFQGIFHIRVFIDFPIKIQYLLVQRIYLAFLSVQIVFQLALRRLVWNQMILVQQSFTLIFALWWFTCNMVIWFINSTWFRTHLLFGCFFRISL